ncbi:Chromosomal replication initiator protein DnaA [Crateriforma conspicua]|uniref:Chromosomal replication initiator protein DnaA n=2 Tax=Planctomycetaceae TaxID=126 RepID=A0A5C6G1K0_9PLAN|nr:Chromosomal replication initiator protein DnaA [Crateriforma conspicua]
MFLFGDKALKEDCATGMSSSHGSTDDKEVVDRFKEALMRRIGEDRFRLWFGQGVDITVQHGDDQSSASESDQAAQLESRFDAAIVLNVRGQFAADRMQSKLQRELRAAAMAAAPQPTDGSPPPMWGYRIEVRPPAVQQTLADDIVDPAPPAVAKRAARPAATASHTDRRPASRRHRRGGRSSESIATLWDHSQQQRDQKECDRNAPAQQQDGQSHDATRRQESKPRSSRTADSTPAAAAASTDVAATTSIDEAASVADPSGNPPSANTPPPKNRSANNHSAAANSSSAPTPATGGCTGAEFTMANFLGGPSNQLALTAARMACQSPGSATPLYFHGPSGVGKTHLAQAIAAHMRQRHRMRRVMFLSAERFTNDFIQFVGTSGLSAFRRRYREVDALIIDDIQFVGGKKATLRELLYTTEALMEQGRPVIFTANRAPSEINGLTGELVGRMASGLVCPLLPLDNAIRVPLMQRLITQRCNIQWPSEVVDEIAGMIDGDGRLVRGVVNLVDTLQRMYGRMPTMDEIRQFGGDILRSQAPPVTLSTIERAVCQVFDLDDAILRSNAQTRTVSEPRMLAMYLARQKTSSAFSEIAKHYGGRSHSTAIAASKKVTAWIESGKLIGRGPKALSAEQAVQRIEQVLRTG